MRFEPIIFIRLATENGITLTRIGKNIRVCCREKSASVLWLNAIKNHKKELIKHLPEDGAERPQLDLFLDYDNIFK